MEREDRETGVTAETDKMETEEGYQQCMRPARIQQVRGRGDD